MATADEILDPVAWDDELARVRRWRTRQFARLGYSLPRAARLAETRTDVHEVAALIARGASLDQAVALAEPLDATPAQPPTLRP